MIKKRIRNLILGKKSSSEKYINYLKSLGMIFGNNVTIVDPQNFTIDTSYPYLIEVGNYVTFSDHVTIMTHDYSWSVIARCFPGEIYPVSGKVIIGNNVFIGTHATILNNVTIGNNCVIGAGAVVTNDIPDNSIAVGIPARVIMSVEELKERQKASSERTIRNIICEYKKKNRSDRVSDDYLREYLAWFCSKEDIKENHPIYYSNRRMELWPEDLECRRFKDIEELVNYYS